jgi:hypothetical protein
MPFLIGGILILLVSFGSYYSSYFTPKVIATIANFLRILILLSFGLPKNKISTGFLS